MLDSMLSWDNLCNAWEQVAENRGAPGVDGVSIRRFGRHWEENLRRLQGLVRGNTYRPARLRRTAIPRPNGGQRLLSIPTVADRVLQRAMLNVLDHRFDRCFLDCSFGYRSGRGLREAVASILRHRDRGLRWVLDADIDDCFDSLDHGLLLDFLGEQVDHPTLMGLIRAWLKLGRRYANPDRGIPLGMPLSPLCCNVYLHRMDLELVRSRWALVRYADDFVILCPTEERAEQARQVVSDVLAALKLRMEPNKTRIASFHQGFDFLGVRFQGQNYSFLWRQRRIEVSEGAPAWLWDYMPSGYE